MRVKLTCLVLADGLAVENRTLVIEHTFRAGISVPVVLDFFELQSEKHC